MRLATLCSVLILLGARLTWADPPLPSIPALSTNVTSFGAFGDGISNNAAAIQSAINAVSTAGGGTVVVSSVGILTNYLSGPINLASQVCLQIDTNTVLRMLPMSSWPSAATPFIKGSGLHDIAINGAGTIDGQGTNWWSPLASSRPHFIDIGNCTRVLIQNVTLQNPPTFHIYMKSTDVSVTIQGITINTPFDSHNTDGADITSTNVLIRNCSISTGDDDLEIGGSSPATDITVSNCTFGTGHGVSIGSFTQGGVNNLIVSNCSWTGTEYGVKIKTDRDRGGVMQNLKYCDLTMTNVNFPIAMYMDYNALGSPSKSIPVTPANAAADTTAPITNTTPTFSNITISNLTAVGNSGIQGPGNIAGILYGLPESPITNVTLCKVNILGRTSDGTFCIYHARGIKIIDSNLTAPTSGTNTLTLYNAEVTVTNSAANANVVTITGLGSPSNTVFSLFNGQAGMGSASVLGANPLLTLASSTLTVNNNMNVGNSSTLNFGLGTNVTKTVVTGSLTLGGTLNIADGGGFNTGTYTLFTYGGTLNTGGLTLGTIPSGSFTCTIDTNTAGVVKLTVTGGSPTPPVAAFSGSPTNGAVPLVVTFIDGSTGTITNRSWDFGDGATSNTLASSLTHTYNSVGSYDVSLAVAGPAGTDTLTRTSYITVTHAAPVITAGATVSNAALQVGNTIVVVAGDTNVFSVGATDPEGNPLNYQWSFGDGVTNAWSPSNTVDHAYTTNCGPYDASVTISNGLATTTSNFTIVVACELNVGKLAPKLNFAKTNSDSCTVSGLFNLPPNPTFAGKLATLDIGGGSLTFTIPSKGSAVNGKSKFSTPTLNKKSGLWTLKASFKNGSWQADWVNYGMTNATVAKPGALVSDLPVILLLDTEAFMATTNLHYTATQGKSGAAK